MVTKDNYHMQINEVAKGNRTVWTSTMVTRLQAVQAKKDGYHIVPRKEEQDGAILVCTLCKGDMFYLKESETYHVVRCVSDGNVEYVSIYDARKQADLRGAGGWTKRSVEKLRQLGFVKVSVSPIGEATPCHD